MLLHYIAIVESKLFPGFNRACKNVLYNFSTRNDPGIYIFKLGQTCEAQFR